MPKNLCAVLAEETDGSIFDIQKWRDVKPTLGDKFEDAFTKLVAKKGMPTECQNCECVPDESGIGMPICRDCSYGVDDVSRPTLRSCRLYVITMSFLKTNAGDDAGL